MLLVVQTTRRQIMDEVKTSMTVKNQVSGMTREIFRTFPTCEQAWDHMTRTMNLCKRKRAKKDREHTICGYYYGKTITGKTYGGMHIIAGSLVRPDEHDRFRLISSTTDYYSAMDFAIASL
jgi:hypothetical protein